MVLDELIEAEESLFGGFSFRDDVDVQQARDLFDQLINILSERPRERIGVIWAQEARPAYGLYYSIRRHMHANIVANASLPTREVKADWMKIAGFANVEVYNCEMDGIGYSLKMRDEEACEWGTENLRFYNQMYVPKNKSDRQPVQRYWRRLEISRAWDLQFKTF